MFEKLLKKVERGQMQRKPLAHPKNRKKKTAYAPKDNQVLHQLGVKILKDAR